MLWSEYFKKVNECMEQEDIYEKYQDSEKMEAIKKLFKKKWKLGVSVEDAFYDIFGLI